MKTGPFAMAFALVKPFLVVWRTIEVGKSLLVYDGAIVLVEDKEACEALNPPAEDGCRVKGRLEANINHTWRLQPIRVDVYPHDLRPLHLSSRRLPHFSHQAGRNRASRSDIGPRPIGPVRNLAR